MICFCVLLVRVSLVFDSFCVLLDSVLFVFVLFCAWLACVLLVSDLFLCSVGLRFVGVFSFCSSGV